VNMQRVLMKRRKAFCIYPNLRVETLSLSSIATPSIGLGAGSAAFFLPPSFSVTGSKTGRRRDSGCPCLHGCERAAFPHRALTSGANAKAWQRMRMIDARKATGRLYGKRSTSRRPTVLRQAIRQRLRQAGRGGTGNSGGAYTNPSRKWAGGWAR
jgi:hypothetical protein